MAVKDWLELVKFRIVALSALLAADGYLLAGKPGNLKAFLAAAVGTALMAASASLINMLLERRTDAVMERTRNRPLPAGRIGIVTAITAAAATGASGLACLFPFSAAAGWIGLAALVSYGFAYTPLKRLTPWAFTAGIAPGAAPPLIGWAAATGHADGAGMLVFLWLCAWQVPHVLAIHVYLGEDYARARIPVLPKRYGERVTLLLTLPFTVAAAVLAWWSAVRYGLGGIFTWTAAIGGAALLAGHLAALARGDIFRSSVGFKRATLWYASVLSLGQLAAAGFKAFGN